MAWHLGGHTDEVSKYLRLKFSRLQTCSTELVHVPPRWSLDYLTEVDLAANILYQAYQNQGTFGVLIPKMDLIVIGSSHRLGRRPIYRSYYRPRQAVGRRRGQIESQIPATFSPPKAPYIARHRGRQVRQSPRMVLTRNFATRKTGDFSF